MRKGMDTSAQHVERRPPVFSPQALAALLLQGRHAELSEALLAVLKHFRETTYARLDGQGLDFVNAFVQHFLHLFTQPEYGLQRPHALEFVRLGATVANLVSLSAFGTTEPFLRLLERSPGHDLGKFLTLLSARNPTLPDRAAYFDRDPALANAWFGAYGETYASGLVRPEVVANLRAHYAFDDDRLDAAAFPLDAYFASTYVGGGADARIKWVLNRAVRKAAGAAGLSVRLETPALGRVAVLSGNWRPEHSVYRITSAYVEALKEAGFRLTFVRLGRKPTPELGAFDDVRELAFDGAGRLDLGPIQGNDFAAAVFPDVGMTPHSIALANLRVAPVMVALLGHSVSTYGSLVDYFVSGGRVEEGPNGSPWNYSERLVLLPGAGAVHDRPRYEPSGRRPAGGSPVRVNAPWNAQKVNYEFALTLRELLRRATRPVRLRLFVGASLNRRNDLPIFARDLEALLGPGAVEVVAGLSYHDYMARMEEGDLTLDSFPFGGCNTVADSLFLRRLVVCREGEQWYNRVGPAMLRSVGLGGLACATEGDYLEAAHRLIHDDLYRDSLQKGLDAADLDATVFDRSEAAAFPRALAYLLANHERLQAEPGRVPIRVPGG